MKPARNEIPPSEIDAQKNIMARVKSFLTPSAKQPAAFVDTYGCQQNESDSEKLRGMLSEMGYGFTRDENEADIIILNTCAVREHAEKRVFGNVGALVHTKRQNPNQIIAVCGGMAQQAEVAERIKRSFRHVDLVFGPHVLWRFPEMLEKILTERGRIFDISGDENAIAEGLPMRRDGTTKAWLSIMYGCNNFCSYCIVPYVRGRERSRRVENILPEVRELVDSGYKDITLLGQNVNSYGKDLGGTSFASLLREINAIPGEFLIRFMTSHPKDAGEELFKAMAECKKVARHIHLPFQAGSDRILTLMNRRYTQADYLSLIDLARKHMPNIVITSDIIVGFPGEAFEEFEETLHVLEKARFDALFTFIYSKRPGTPAAEMQDDVSREEKQRRFDMLLKLQNSISEEKHKQYVGKTVRVLIDGESADPRYPYTARTNGGRLVHLSALPDTIDARPGEIGSFADVKITRASSWSLFSE